MYVARILYPVKVLGPGLRIGIWFVGCKHECKGCSNPELWEVNDRYYTTVNDVMQLISMISDSKPVDGVTLTGGDPLEQEPDLMALLERIKVITDDILLYTGYSYETVEEKWPDLLKRISVLIDGKYDEEQNHGEKLRGSSNQRIIILDKAKEEKYKVYLETTENSVQNFFINNSAISVGIHLPGYENELDQVMGRMGLRHVK